MTHFKLQLADDVLLPVTPIFIHRRRLLESKTKRRPLRPRNSDPRRLLRQCAIHKLVALVQVNCRRWFEFLERCDAADVVEVCVGERDCL